MAAREAHFAEYAGATLTTTSSSLSSIVSLTPNPVLSTAKRYAVFWTAVLATQAGGEGNRARGVLDNGAGTVYDECTVTFRHENQQWTASGFAVLEAGVAKPATLRVAFSKVGGNQGSQAKFSRIVVMELGALDQFVAADAPISTSSSVPSDTGATLAFTPATAGDYLIFCQAKASASLASNSDGVRTLLLVDGTTVWDEQHLLFHVSAVVPQTNIYRATLSAAPHTVKIQQARLAASLTVTHEKNRILALRVDDLPGVTSALARARSSTTSTTDVIKATLTETLSNGDVYAAFWNATWDTPSTTHRVHGAFRRDGVEVVSTQIHSAGSSTVSFDEFSGFAPDLVTGTGAAATWTIGFYTNNSGTAVGASGAEIHLIRLTSPAFAATGAVSQKIQLIAGAGVLTMPVYAGTGALAHPKQTLAAAGASAVPVHTGAGAVTQPKQTLAATAASLVPVFTATAAPAQPKQTIASLATTGASSSGAGAILLPKQALSAGGATKPPDVFMTASVVMPKQFLGSFAERDHVLNAAMVIPTLLLTGTGRRTKKHKQAMVTY